MPLYEKKRGANDKKDLFKKNNKVEQKQKDSHTIKKKKIKKKKIKNK